MGVVGGKYSVVNNIAAMRQWGLTHTSTPTKGVASNTRGGPVRRPGNRDWSGNVQAYGGMPAVLPGEAFAFAGYCGPSDNIEGNNGDVYSGNAIVDSVAINWNYESGEIISHTINFSGNGALSKSTGIHTDNTTPSFIGTNELPTATGDGSDICGITSVALTLTSENKQYVNSCTSGYNKRLAGNFDAMLAIGVQDTNLDEFLAEIGDSLELSLPINDTEFWLLRWMLLKEFSGLTVNRETGDVESFTANFELNGFDDVDGIGVVIAPDETVVWGEE